MEAVLFLSFVTASIAYTVSETKLFRPFRERIARASRLLGELCTCGYCLGHWIAFGLVAIYRPRLLHGWWLLDYVLTALIIAWFGAVQWALMCWLMHKAGK